MFSSVSGFHHRGGDPYETGSDTPMPNFILIAVLSVKSLSQDQYYIGKSGKIQGRGAFSIWISCVILSLTLQKERILTWITRLNL